MSKPNEYITDLFHKLRDDISWIRQKLFTEKPKLESADTPKEYAIDAVHTDNNANCKAYDSEAVIRATLNMPKAIRVEAETHERNKKWFKDRMFLVQVAAVLAASIYAVIAYRQWHDSGHNFRVDQRAWLGVSQMSLNEMHAPDPVTAMVTVTNFGKTPALHVKIIYTIHPSDTQVDISEYSQHSVEKLDSKPLSQSVLFPNANMMLFPSILNPDETGIEAVKTGHKFIYIFGTIEYGDIFKETHSTHFCNLYNHNVKAFHTCDTYNSAN
jgi:hypothetical protein